MDAAVVRAEGLELDEAPRPSDCIDHSTPLRLVVWRMRGEVQTIVASSQVTVRMPAVCKTVG